MTNMRKSRLSYAKQNQLIDHFAAGATARTAAGLCGVNRPTVIYFFRRLRQIVELETAPDGADQFGGEVEVDESCFGGRMSQLCQEPSIAQLPERLRPASNRTRRQRGILASDRMRAVCEASGRSPV